MVQLDYIIVGQGLAGSLLCNALLQSGARVKIFDKDHFEAASKVAAGIINPITGRRFVKSWMIETLLSHAKTIYTDLETKLKTRLLYERNVLRVFSDVKEENEWHSRNSHKDIVHFVNAMPAIAEFNNKINTGVGFGEIKHALQIDIGNLLDSYRKYLVGKNMVINTSFNYQNLKINEDEVIYGNFKARKIIFCEGAKARYNPWFEYLPFEVSKGEALIVKIPGTRFERLLKHKLMIAPIRYDLYWVGSNYEWNPGNSNPSFKTRENMLETLTKILKVKFELVSHIAAIRPTVKDRRPFLGSHSHFSRMFIFNGLGTKGASLGPYWADRMAAHLEFEKPIPPEVDIKRFS